MATFTEVLAPDIILDNMTAYRQLRDGENFAIIVYPNEGYVIYDSAAEDAEPVTDPETGDLIFDPETGEPLTIPVTYYFTSVIVPYSHFSVDTFTWVAVPRDSVDENYIFGADEPDHEVM